MIRNEWKWSNGEDFVRTVRPKKTNNLTNIQEPVHVPIDVSLEENDTFAFEPQFSRNDNESVKMREDLDNKISQRELLFQRGTNPFVQTNNYVEDIMARDVFLKPKNTTFDKIKFTE